MKFKLGDTVTWTSQSGGYQKTKKGIVVAVVPEGKRPDGCIPAGMRSGSSSGFGMSRDHESYLIQIGRSRWLYWPRVINLKIDEAAVDLDSIFLEVCPCGQYPSIYRQKGQYRVSCPDCCDTKPFDTPQQAADRWNELRGIERKNKRYAEAKEVAQTLLDYVNVMGNKNDDVIEEIYRGHRTLQQGVTRFCAEWLARCAKMHDEGDFDLRCQASCELGKEFMKIPSDKRALPLI